MALDIDGKIKASFTDEDLFTIRIPASLEKPPTAEFLVQTDEIQTQENGTQVVERAEAEVQTMDPRAINARSSSSRAGGRDGSGEDGKDEEGKGGGGDDDGEFDRRYGGAMRGGAEEADGESPPPVPPGLLPMLARKVPEVEAALKLNIEGKGFKAFFQMLRRRDSTGGQVADPEHKFSLAPPPFAFKARLQCTSVAWNASGALLVASFGRLDVSGWCSQPGMLCAWPVFRRDFDAQKGAPPDVMLEHSSCLMCVAPHPKMPSIVAAGSFNGEVIVYDLSLASSSGSQATANLVAAATEAARRKAKKSGGGGGDDGDDGGDDDTGEAAVTIADPVLHTSRIDDYFHREPVGSLRWVHDNDANGYALVSISADGKVRAAACFYCAAPYHVLLLLLLLLLLVVVVSRSFTA